ncbi:MAG: hybrid sensor histidine kinase/response regulator [Chloroflexi bacterium]|nr:hybrid sensor histidine kinase/response regulator [Chloroflexota bacterium]MBI3169550.1 hybrid sensor histidine kinase/response regulator [Chloroflexota bacterium]
MKPTILIVDDEPSGQQVLESILLEQGYTLEFASTGKEALKKAGDLKPDLILLDIMLPEVDGIQVCQMLRRDRELAKIPVVMLTALNDRDIRIASLDAGADDFISKPFDRAELRARVRSITRLNKYRLLYERNMMFSWIGEQASDGYLLVQNGDEVVYANPRARFYLGLNVDTSASLAGSFMEIAVRQYRPQPQEAWKGWPSPATKGTPHVRYLVRPETETSHEFWIEVTTFEIPNADPGSSMIRLRDVTADILNRRNTRSFGEAITHKVRTPMTHIVSSLDLLARHAPKLSPEEIAKLSGTALMGAKRLSETLDRILKYTRLYTNANNTDGFELSGFKELTGRIAAEVGITDVVVNMHGSLEQVKIALPLQSMEVLLWEILGNSKKFHPAHTPQVIVDVTPASSQGINLQFSDDGITLSPKQLTTAWLPYYQGEKDFTGEMPGMGLGLSTVNAIVWGAGGNSHLMNRSDKPGVVIRLTIPPVKQV